MELQLEAGGGRATFSSDSPAADLGRGDLSAARAADRTVSRRHVSVSLLPAGGEPRLAFEVVGKNPVVVRSAAAGDRVYRRGEAGELGAGDSLSLSLKAPSFWVLRRRGAEEVESAVLDAVTRRERRTQERKERERREAEEAMEVAAAEEETSNGEVDLGVEGSELDLASIDPVREFGFLSMGHEFDNYPKGRIRPPKDWNWFLEESGRSSGDEDDEVNNEGGKSKSKSRRKMKKKGRESGDEEWAGESEDEKDSLSKVPSVKRPKYMARSKGPNKPHNETSKDKWENEEVEDEEDEEDETLGGFIVEDDDTTEEQSEEEEEEEEFNDEEDD